MLFVSFFQKLKMQIWDEYNRNKNDSEYLRTRREFQYLHDKLAHIKMLVHEYDTKALTTEAS